MSDMPGPHSSPISLGASGHLAIEEAGSTSPIVSPVEKMADGVADIRGTGSLKRFRIGFECPVCGGHSQFRRGTGTRCHGFVAPDGRYAYCSREDFAGGIPIEESSTFAHLLQGDCQCGSSHDPASGKLSRAVRNDKAATAAIASADVIYEYVDEHGELLFEVCRKDPKHFVQRRPDGNGGYIWDLNDVRRVLYHLPEVISAVAAGDTVYVVEGEKDVEAIRSLDCAATCNPGGAAKWDSEYTKCFQGANVIIVADRDGEQSDFAGQRHAADVYRSLKPVAESVAVVQAIRGKDSHDALITHELAIADAFEPLNIEPWLMGNSTADDSQVTDGTVVLSEIGISGDRLRMIRERPETVSPMPGILDFEPSLHILVADAKTGKTTLSCQLGLAWAQGLAPWIGAPALPAGRVLIVSNEQSALKIDRLMRRLTKTADLGDEEVWTDRVTIIARDAELGPSGRQMLSLDNSGAELLRAGLDQAIAAGDPYRFLILDSFSRLKPTDVEENDNDGVVAWLTGLANFAIDYEIYVWVVHHAGHNTTGNRARPISAGRGASAIGQVAQVVLYLTKVPGELRKRKLTVEGNTIDECTMVFRVSEEPEPAEHVTRFIPDEDQLHNGWEEIFRSGVPLSINAIAKKLESPQGSPPKRDPSGHWRRLATRLCGRLEKLGEIEQLENGRWIRRP